jgi:RimJ/RimL family protein N-acetyltransferase
MSASPTPDTEPFSLPTARLWLRDLREADIAPICRYCADPEVSRYMLPGQADPNQITQKIQQSIADTGRQPRRYYGLGVVLQSEERLIGTCTLSLVRQGALAFIGWDFDRDYWCQGFATEAARALVDYTFQELPPVRISAHAVAANHASRRVMQKIGMRQQYLGPGASLALMRAYHIWRFVVSYSISRERWMQQATSTDNYGSST